MLNYDAPPAIPEWRYRVKRDGQDITRSASAWAADYTLGDPVGETPLTVGRGEASGSIDLMVPREPDSVSDGRTPDPWTDPDWPPQPGAQITVEVSGDGNTWYPAADLLADQPWDDSTGAAGAKLRERVARLSVPVTLPSAMRIMPPAPGLTNKRSVSMHAGWLIDRLLYEARTPTTLPWIEGNGLLLRCSMQGSLWPTQGFTTVAGNSFDDPGSMVASAPWGWCMTGFSTSWDLGKNPDTGVRTVQTGPDWKFHVLVSDDHTGNCVFELRRADGTGTNATLTIYSNRSASLTHGSMTINVAADPDSPVIGVRRLGTGWTLYAGRNAATGTTAVTASYDQVGTATSAGVRIGTILMYRIASNSTSPATYPANLDDRPAIFGISAPNSETVFFIYHTPRIENRTVLDVLDEISTAQLWAYGWDEQGRLLIQSWAGQIYGAGTRRTLTTGADILEKLSRSWSLRNLARQVQVTYQDATWDVRDDYSITLWQGSGDQLNANTPEDTFIDTPDDEEWYALDPSPAVAGPSSVPSRAGRGTFVGGSKVIGKDSDGDDVERTVYPSEYAFAFQRLGLGSLKLTETSLTTTMTRRTIDAKSMPAGFRGRDLPLLRGHARLVRTDAQTDLVNAATTNAAEIRVYQHDSGPWVIPGIADRVRDYIASVMSDPLLVLEQVRIQPDPRIQVGDTHFLKSERLGLDLTVLVIGKHLSCTPADGFTMTLDLAVVDHTPTYPTWRVWEAHAQRIGSTYAAFEAANTGNTWAGFEFDPIGAIDGD